MKSTTTNPKYYHYGYRFISPQDKKEEWEYVVQMHKNQNGTHFDLRLAKPGKEYAYSWASKKPPISITRPVLARRTHDHSLEHLDFEGPLETAKGSGTVKIISRGTAKLHSIDEEGIRFDLDSGENLLLKNLRGKKYLIVDPTI